MRPLRPAPAQGQPGPRHKWQECKGSWPVRGQEVRSSASALYLKDSSVEGEGEHTNLSPQSHRASKSVERAKGKGENGFTEHARPEPGDVWSEMTSDSEKNAVARLGVSRVRKSYCKQGK